MGLELSRRYPPRELGRPSRSTKTRRSYLWNSSRARAPTPRIAGAEHEQTVSTSLARRGGLQTCHPARHMPCGPWRSSALRAPALTTPPCCSPPLRLAGCRGVGHDQRDEHMRSRRAARAPRAATRSVSEHLESLARRGDGGRLERDLKNPAREVEPDGVREKRSATGLEISRACLRAVPCAAGSRRSARTPGGRVRVFISGYPNRECMRKKKQ